jgi:hypothetical protein
MAKANRRRQAAAAPGSPAAGVERNARSTRARWAVGGIAAAIIMAGGIAFYIVANMPATQPAGNVPTALLHAPAAEELAAHFTELGADSVIGQLLDDLATRGFEFLYVRFQTIDHGIVAFVVNATAMPDHIRPTVSLLFQGAPMAYCRPFFGRNNRRRNRQRQKQKNR